MRRWPEKFHWTSTGHLAYNIGIDTMGSSKVQDWSSGRVTDIRTEDAWDIDTTYKTEFWSKKRYLKYDIYNPYYRYGKRD